MIKPNRLLNYVLVLLTLPFLVVTALAKETIDDIVSFNTFIEGKKVESGFVDLISDPTTGHVFLAVDKQLGQFLFHTSLARGIGSNDIGLDRGRLGDTKLVSLVRIGNKVLLQQHNTNYRATAKASAEQQSVAEAFASSVLWGFKIVAEDSARYVIDYSKFLLSDEYQIAAHLKQINEGQFAVDESKSAPYFPMTKSFPDNTELESMVTYVGTEAGELLRSVSPDAQRVTVHLHHSLIRLPEPGYQARAFHPQSGYRAFKYQDYSAPIDKDLTQRYISRHRLEKGETLIYYLDRGTPEPIRSALMEGAGWWAEAFAEAGFDNGFEIKLLPVDADPMDVRYNIVQWVHRSTRGWSYGASLTDPRSGEILKGKVSLGSLRVRQDLLIAQGLLSPFIAGEGSEKAQRKAKAMALARIRQLAAHEIGHTLGLAHNYIASSQNRNSVMDYPHPMLRLKPGQGGVDLSEAYDTNLGAWDKHAISYGYKIVDDEAAFITEHIRAGQQQGLGFVSDADARPAGSAHPAAHLWDSGADVIAELRNTLAVRYIALSKLGANSISSGTPYSEIADVLVPIYYMHRYQTEAVAKVLAGVNYEYSVKGDGEFSGVSPVSGAIQNQAIAALLQALDAELLTPSEALLDLIPPKPIGYELDRENSATRTAPLFDSVTAAEAIVDETLKFVFDPNRLARLEQQHARQSDIVGVEFLLDEFVDKLIKARPLVGLTAEVQKRTALVMTERLLQMIFDDNQVPEVAAISLAQTRRLGKWLAKQKRADRQYLAFIIDKSLANGDFKARKNAAKMPPGSPI